MDITEKNNYYFTSSLIRTQISILLLVEQRFALGLRQYYEFGFKKDFE
jgi:hypothetical protein